MNRTARSILTTLSFTLLASTSAAAIKWNPPWNPGTRPPVLDPGPVIACAESPNAPYYVSVGSQGPTSVGMSFMDGGDCETSYEVQHRNADVNGPWVTRATFGALTANTTQTFSDSGLLEDTYYCYRVIAHNSYGSRGSTNNACMKTRQSSANAKNLHDVRLRVKVASTSGAGTDSGVQVRLNAKPSTGWYPINNETWLDYGRNDFSTGDNWTFVLNRSALPSGNVGAIVSDISQIAMYVDGSDQLCVSELELIANGAPAYQGTFSPARCGTQGTPITVTKNELRAHPLWQSFSTTSAPIDLSEEGVLYGLEASIGHRMHGTEAYWNDSPAPYHVGGLWLGIQANPMTDQGFIVNAPVRVDVNNWFDPEVLVQMVMEMESTCTNNRTTVKVRTANIYADVGFDWWADIIHTLGTAGFYFLAEPFIDGYAEGEVEPVEMSFSIPVNGCYVVTYQEGYGFEIGVP